MRKSVLVSSLYKWCYVQNLLTSDIGIFTKYLQAPDNFYPTPPPRGAWVFRWQVSPPPPLPPLPLPHLQICQRTLTIETENAAGGGGAWVFRCDAILFPMLLLGTYKPQARMRGAVGTQDSSIQ